MDWFQVSTSYFDGNVTFSLRFDLLLCCFNLIVGKEHNKFNDNIFRPQTVPKEIKSYHNCLVWFLLRD